MAHGFARVLAFAPMADVNRDRRFLVHALS